MESIFYLIKTFLEIYLQKPKKSENNHNLIIIEEPLLKPVNVNFFYRIQ